MFLSLLLLFFVQIFVYSSFRFLSLVDDSSSTFFFFSFIKHFFVFVF